MNAYQFGADEWRVVQLRLHADRFWSKVAKADGCWLWTAARFRYGYGSFWLDVGLGASRCTLSAHRCAFEIENGPIPPGMVVMHSCDTPLCCRPDHLQLGTALDNARDMTTKGRSTYGARNGRAQLTEAQARSVQTRRESGESWTAMAREFGVTPAAIRFIASGRTWKRLV